jgi:hypothetical protein
MILRTLAALTARCFLAVHGCDEPGRRAGDRGQTTAEYALVIVGAAAVALLLLTWATGSGKITSLLDKVVDTVANMVN